LHGGTGICHGCLTNQYAGSFSHGRGALPEPDNTYMIAALLPETRQGSNSRRFRRGARREVWFFQKKDEQRGMAWFQAQPEGTGTSSRNAVLMLA